MATLGNKAVGSAVKIKVNGTAKDFIIVHQGNPDTSKYDSSCDGTWLLMARLYDIRGWGADNNYQNSDIHNYLNNTFYNLLDTNIKAAIKQVKIPYLNTSIAGISNLSAKIFLLSVYEVGWTQNDDYYFPVEGACLSYFKGTEKIDSKRIAYYNGTATRWWLRSPYKRSTYGTYFVKPDGDYAYVHNEAHGVRPAFILPKTLKVDGSGNIVFNAAPTITSDTASGSDLGEISEPFNIAYTVNDADNDSVTVSEYLDDVQTRTYTATLGAENTFEAVSDPVLFQKILNGQHTLKIIANDGKDNSAAYTVTFNKQVKTASITLAEPLPADDVIKAAVISVTGNIPQDAELEVLVTNNALDDSPVWEDMTQDYAKKINHLFSNKTAANGFAFNFKVTVTRGASGEQGFISSIGGAFE